MIPAPQSWVVPALIHVAVVGCLGIAGKLAVDDGGWEQLVLWTAAVYILVALVLWLRGQRLQIGRHSAYAALAGLLAALGMISLSLALEAGEVTQVIPVTSTYPLVTVALASSLLSERVGARELLATVFVVVGVILISTSG